MSHCVDHIEPRAQSGICNLPSSRCFFPGAVRPVAYLTRVMAVEVCVLIMFCWYGSRVISILARAPRAAAAALANDRFPPGH
jgi:hypothetical protein